MGLVFMSVEAFGCVNKVNNFLFSFVQIFIDNDSWRETAVACRRVSLNDTINDNKTQNTHLMAFVMKTNDIFLF